MIDICAIILRLLPFLSRKPSSRTAPKHKNDTGPVTSENDPTILPLPSVRKKMQARDEGLRLYHGGYTVEEYLATEREFEAEEEGEQNGEIPAPPAIRQASSGEIDYNDPALKFLTMPEGFSNETLENGAQTVEEATEAKGAVEGLKEATEAKETKDAAEGPKEKSI